MKNDINPINTVYFVYTGEKLPRYGISSLKLAREMSASQVHLIGNSSMKKSAQQAKVDFTAIEEFYDSTKFQSARTNISSDAGFRSGFWLKSTERIFILEQFAEFKRLTSLCHAELDQLLFNTSELITALGVSQKKGIFIPFHNPDSVVASLIYINDFNALQSLTSLAGSGIQFKNEMMLMAYWAKANPSMAFALPTLATELNSPDLIVPEGVSVLDVSETRGIVDAAQLGQWIAGIDPRNVPINEKPTTRFIDDPTPGILDLKTLEDVEFRLDLNKQKLKVKSNESEFYAYNLHIHSKCHANIFHQKPSLNALIEKSNKGIEIRIRGMRFIQVKTHLIKVLTALRKNPRRLKIELSWRIKSKLGIRPSSKPFISGDTFRSIANHKWEAGLKNLRTEDLQAGDIVFCESELISELDKEVLSNFNKPITLILGNSDENHSENNVQNLNLSVLGDVFAQNLVEKIEGFQPLPIGIENAWRSNHGLLTIKKVRRSSRENRVNRIMWGFNSATNPIIRGKASDQLRLLSTTDKFANVTPSHHQELLSKYSFVASPPGNGIDTHRTWEAMYFKCVPIVLISYMTSHYEEIGLPIWIVDSYAELSSETEESLSERYYNLSDRFKNQAIWAQYWIDLIQESSRNLKYRA
jgi:hypothetical protein